MAENDEPDIEPMVDDHDDFSDLPPSRGLKPMDMTPARRNVVEWLEKELADRHRDREARPVYASDKFQLLRGFQCITKQDPDYQREIQRLFRYAVKLLLQGSDHRTHVRSRRQRGHAKPRRGILSLSSEDSDAAPLCKRFRPATITRKRSRS